MNLNFYPPPFPMEQIKEKEHDKQTLNFGLNSSSASCNIFFNQTKDHATFYHPQLYQPHHHPQDDHYYAYRGGSSYEMEEKVENGLKLNLWKQDNERAAKDSSSDHGVKWMRLMKKHDRRVAEAGKNIGAAAKIEVNNDSSSYNCNTPIRVCSDCHTTKTPLWRSGPKGPKSLCNACGIRQRKARRAVAAAAAAAANGGGVAASEAAKMKEKMGKNGLKKRCKVSNGGGSSTSSGKKIGFEDFLINLRNKLAIHRVFPQDEKEAAILLMALSSGLVHG